MMTFIKTPPNCDTDSEIYKNVENFDTSTVKNHKTGRDILFMIILIILFLVTGVVLKKRGYFEYSVACFGIVLITLTSLILGIIRDPISIVFVPSYLISLNVKTEPFLDTDKYFPEHQQLENSWKSIREELDNLLMFQDKLPYLKDSFNGENVEIGADDSDGGGWKMFMVMMGNEYNRTAERICPITVSLLKKINDEHPGRIRTAFFSILDGNKEIPIHVGYNKSFIRYQICLKNPQDLPKPFICVNGIKYEWKEGSGVTFDDTFPHKVYNMNKDTRVVLYLDIQRIFESDTTNNILSKFLDITMNHPILTSEVNKINF
jgi:aspartyl/asparaginyl beta-hydroxylase (cupin superfamily)